MICADSKTNLWRNSSFNFDEIFSTWKKNSANHEICVWLIWFDNMSCINLHTAEHFCSSQFRNICVLLNRKFFYNQNVQQKNHHDFVLKAFYETNSKKCKICFSTKKIIYYVSFSNRFFEKIFQLSVRFSFNLEVIIVVTLYKSIWKCLKTHSNCEKINFLKYKKHAA